MTRTLSIAIVALLFPIHILAATPHKGVGCWRTIPAKHSALTRSLFSGRKEKKDESRYRGNFKGLVILVEFTDRKFKEENGRQKYDDILNAPGYTTSEGFRGSVADYFSDQSAGLFDLHFDVVGPYTTSRSHKYYGENDDDENDKRPDEMIAEACRAADADVNFADYDWDGDGEVEEVFVVYAGKGEADSGDDSAVYPHMWSLEESGLGKLTLDGTIVDIYACANELNRNNKINGIGTFCHEFSHCLGLPDFYDVFYTGLFGMGDFDLMCSGNYSGKTFCPVGYTAYEKMACGWQDPIVLSDQDVTVESLKPMSEHGDSYIIYNDGHPDEFYMIENRQETGWDSYYPASGLLITHVDYDPEIWDYNVPNTLITNRIALQLSLPFTNDHERMTLFHADNSTRNDKYDLYPYRDNDSLTATSKPAATLYHKNSLGKTVMRGAITNIKQNDDGTMSFRYRANAKTTAIREVEASDKPGKAYTLDGRAAGTDISTLRRGIYIVDGRKIVK